MDEVKNLLKKLDDEELILKKCAIIWELGNLGTDAEKAVSKLSKILLKSTNWRLRVWTAWSLGRIGSKKAQKALQKLINKSYTSEEEETVVTIAEHALNHLIMGMEFDLPTSPIMERDFEEKNEN